MAVNAADQIRMHLKGIGLELKTSQFRSAKPANDYDPNQYAAIIYGRAPLFILELEKKMGADVFSRFLADYVKKYQWKTADTRQFKSLAQETECNVI